VNNRDPDGLLKPETEVDDITNGDDNQHSHQVTVVPEVKGIRRFQWIPPQKEEECPQNRQNEKLVRRLVSESSESRRKIGIPCKHAVEDVKGRDPHQRHQRQRRQEINSDAQHERHKRQHTAERQHRRSAPWVILVKLNPERSKASIQRTKTFLLICSTHLGSSMMK